MVITYVHYVTNRLERYTNKRSCQMLIYVRVLDKAIGALIYFIFSYRSDFRFYVFFLFYFCIKFCIFLFEIRHIFVLTYIYRQPISSPATHVWCSDGLKET